MSYVFNHFNTIRKVLELRPFGLFTDVDGTISEIAPSPAEAKVSPTCREALATLAGILPVVAAVSGRSAVEARKMVGIDNIVYIGNHGYERWTKGKTELLPGVEEYPARITAVLDGLAGNIAIDGIIVENKGPTAAVHYRRCRDHEAALKSILAAVEEPVKANGLKISLGKLVVELRPTLEANKGTAVYSLIAEYRLNGAIYLGDDLTDIDVFRAFHGEGLSFTGLAIGVTGGEIVPDLVQEADFTLNGVGDVERFLKQVAAEVADMPAS